MICSWTRSQEPKLFTALPPSTDTKTHWVVKADGKIFCFFFCCQGVRWCLDHYVMTSILAVLVVVVVFRGWLASLSLSLFLSLSGVCLFLTGSGASSFLRPDGPRQRLVYGFSHHINTSHYLQEARSSLLVMCAVLWRGYFRFFGLFKFISLATLEHLVIGGFAGFEELSSFKISIIKLKLEFHDFERTLFRMILFPFGSNLAMSIILFDICYLNTAFLGFWKSRIIFSYWNSGFYWFRLIPFIKNLVFFLIFCFKQILTQVAVVCFFFHHIAFPILTRIFC